jgi:predicted kinase
MQNYNGQEKEKKKNHSRKLILLVGESGSGKSTIAKKMVADNPDKYVRLSKDDLRIELRNDPSAPTKSGAFEEFVGKIQAIRADKALKEDKTVLIDDTNLNPNTRLKWEKFANHKAEFDTYRVFTSLEDCIARDAQREGSARVGQAVIHRQFLMSKRLPIDYSKPIVICDLDGTLADSFGIRNVYDESLVGKDKIVDSIRTWVNALAEDHTILIVSGRKSTCGDATVEWLNRHGVKFDFILMRHGFHTTQPDTFVKQGILDELLGMVPKEQIRFCIDDRWKVVTDCWRKNGLTVYPVRGTIHHREDCTYEMSKEDKKCPECWALADF